MKEMNSSRREIARENNEILKETTTSESHSKRVSDIEREDKLVWEHNKEDTIMSVDQLDKMYSPQDEASKREIKNPEKINNVTITDKRVYQRPFCDIIGKREQRKEELEKMEGDLRERLDMLECSMSAVMVWNICKMSQGAPVCKMRRILEKQFKDTRELSCRSTPSCHYDCRVREVEAERKLALKKTEEARTLWSEKLATLEQRKQKLEEARRIQEEQKNAMERLNEEAKALRETMEKKTMETDESCQYGECGDTWCKKRWLDRVSSVTSIESEDIQCLEKLQQLAEEEVIIKRGIAELERREEAYMRTLQQADELWSKIEGDAVSTTNALQEQLDMKIAANQQLADRVCELEDALEKCRTKLAACRAELEKFLSIEKVEATTGRDDDFAKVTDKVIMVKAKVVHRPIGRVDDIATVEDDEVLARVEVADEEVLAKVETVDEKALARVEVVDEETLAEIVLIDAKAALVGDDKYVSVKPDLVDLAVDRPADLVQIEDAESIVRPEDITYEQQRLKKVREYLTKLGSLEELYKDGEPCAPDFVCNDVVASPTGMTDKELITLGVGPPKKLDEKLADEEERERQFREELARKETDDIDDIEKKEKKIDDISGVEVEKKIVTKAKEQIIEAIDVPIREIEIQKIQVVVDDKPITIPNDVRAPEIKKIETDQDIVIQRDTILLWINMIDTIRISAAKHPDYHIIKKDADILIKQIGDVGIRPKKVEENHVITIAEKKQEKVIEENELKVKEGVIIETKLQDELIIPKDKEMESQTKKSEEMDESKHANDVEKLKEIPQIDKMADRKDTRNAEIIETEISEVPSLEKKTKIEQDVEEALPIIDVTEIKIMPEIVLPIIDLIEREKIEPSELPIVDIKEKPVSDMAREQIIIEEAPLIVNGTEELLILNAITEKKVEIEESESTTDIIQKKIEIEEVPTITDTVKEIIEIKEPTEEMKQPVAEAEKDKEIEEISKKVIPPIKLFEEREKEEPTEEIITEKEIEMQPEPMLLISRIENNIKEIEEITMIKRPEEAPLIVNGTEELLILNAITEKKVEIEESSTTDIIQKKIEIEEVPTITDTVKEIIEIKEPTEEMKQPVAEAEKDKEIEEISKKVIPPIKLFEEREKEEPTEEIITEKEIEMQPEPMLLISRIENNRKEIEGITMIKRPMAEAEIKKKDEPTEEIITEEEIEMQPEPMLLISRIENEIKEIEGITMIKRPMAEAEIKKKDEPTEEIITEEEIEMQPEPILLISRIENEMKEIEGITMIKRPVAKAEMKKEKDEEIEEILKKVIPPIKLFEEREKEEIPESVEKEEILAKIALPTKLIEDKKEKELKLVEIKPKITEIKPDEIEMPAIPIDARLLAQPYLIIAQIKEKELLQIVPPMKLPCAECCTHSPVIETTQRLEIMRTNVAQTEVGQTKVVQTEIVETEIVQVTTQPVAASKSPRTPPLHVIDEYLKQTELKAPSSTEIADDRPEITGRKMLWRKRLKDQSTVTTASIGSQTDKTSHVSHDRIIRDERERARVTTDELLRSIKIAARLARPDAEREIRTINYGGRSDETRKLACNCCQCGKISTPPSTRPRLKVRPQIDAKTATPPAVDAFKRIFIPPKIDRPISYDRLCPDCKAKIQSMMPHKKHHIEKIVEKISRDQESCDCALSIDKSCRAPSRKREIEKKDQGCLAKMPKRKTNLTEQKRRNNLQSILENSDKFDIEPLSPSCICYKLEKISAEPIRKGNCYCAD